jgi:hypothetical protein
MLEKIYIPAQDLLEDSFRLGRAIILSGFKPDFIVGIWRGGTPVGIAVQELLDYSGIRADHIAIRTSSYEGIDRRGKQIRVHGLNYIVKNANAEDAVLIVDDVFETGLSIQAVMDTLRLRARKNTPGDIRVATVYYKPARNLTNPVPDYHLHATDQWLIFPHELAGLSRSEIDEHKPWLSGLIDGLPEATSGS